MAATLSPEMTEALERYFIKAQVDYTKSPTGRNSDYKIWAEPGRKYIRIAMSYCNSTPTVHSFIVADDSPGSKFKKGDILLAATYKAPAVNHARGNIFSNYHINWTGPNYMR